MVLVSVEPNDLAEAEEESASLILLGGLRTDEVGGLKTLTPHGDLQVVQVRTSSALTWSAGQAGSRLTWEAGPVGCQECWER